MYNSIMPRKTFTLIGILLVFIELSGFSSGFKSTVGVIFGVLIIFFSIRRKKQNYVGLDEENSQDFSDNTIIKNNEPVNASTDATQKDL